MKVVSWNINSVRARLDRLLAWLEKHEPDVVCLQETKVTDENFPQMEIEAAGYQSEFSGQKSYNGVAILSREPLSDVVRGFEGDGGEDKRMMAGTVGGVRVVTVYVPNGQKVGSEQYTFKLGWLDRFRGWLDGAAKPSEPLLVCGDFNVAPDDRDVWDPEVWKGKVLATDAERERFRKLLEWGLSDAQRVLSEEGGIYTWWDYRMGGFRRDWGLRIDHFLITKPLADRLVSVEVDREERGGEKPSDHAPVVAVFEG